MNKTKKYKVKQTFIDKNTKSTIRVGEIIELSEERAAEILKKGSYIEEVQEEKSHLDIEEMKKWSVKDLRKLAEDMELDTSGTKEQLLERICEVELEPEIGEETKGEESGNDEESEN